MMINSGGALAKIADAFCVPENCDESTANQ